MIIKMWVVFRTEFMNGWAGEVSYSSFETEEEAIEYKAQQDTDAGRYLYTIQELTIGTLDEVVLVLL